MRFLDTFVDTRAKRKALVKIIAILLLVYMAFTYFVLALQITFLQAYEDLFALLQLNTIQRTFIARVIIACMALPELTLLKVGESIWNSFHLLDILTISSLVMLASYRNVRHQIYYRMMLFIIVFIILLIAIFALPALQANTLQVAIIQLKYIGITFIIGSSSIILLSCYVVFRYEASTYYQALSYRVVEIIDNEEIGNEI